MTDHFTDISLAARLSCLPTLLASVAAWAEQQGIAADNVLRLQLIVEELFTNTIVHGHRGDSDSPVRLSLKREDQQIHLRYADSAPPFNIVEIAPKSALTAEVGGLGITLITGMSKSCHYARQGVQNVIDIVL